MKFVQYNTKIVSSTLILALAELAIFCHSVPMEYTSHTFVWFGDTAQKHHENALTSFQYSCYELAQEQKMRKSAHWIGGDVKQSLYYLLYLSRSIFSWL